MSAQYTDANDDPRTLARGLVATAWVLALACIGLAGQLLHLALRSVPAAGLIPWIVGAAVAAIAAMGFTFAAMLRRAGAAGSHALFETWFPLFMTAVPIGGPVIALWSAIKLLFRDKLTAATITTSSGASRSVSHHEARPLYGSGRPGGLVLVTLALVQPVGALVLFTDLPGKLGLPPLVQQWTGGSLQCGGRAAYRAQGRTFNHPGGTLLQAAGHCTVELTRCTLDGTHTMRVDDGARVVLRDCTVTTQHPLRLDGGARLRVHGGTIRAGSGAHTAVQLYGRSGVRIEGATVKGGVGSLGDGPIELLQARVEGRTAVDVRGRTQLTVQGGKLAGEREALSARGRARVQIRGAVLVAPRALTVRDSAEASVEGGTLHGDPAARAYGSGRAVLAGVKVTGALKEYGGTIKQVAAGRAAGGTLAAMARRKRLIARYGKLACKGLLACYDGHEGPVGGTVRAVVGDAGKVTSVSVKLQGTPEPIARCIREAARARVVPGFQGPRGTLRCSYRGSVTAESRLLETSGSFRPAPGATVHSEAPGGAR